jgi:hypothetical protein
MAFATNGKEELMMNKRVTGNCVSYTSGRFGFIILLCVEKF